ncbi:MAG: 4Fe-4S dicluster domain-containing protein [Pelolinea sp.]|nr:4Fe-4S dicluster domain-containing protein [Pelolinea sp.]
MMPKLIKKIEFDKTISKWFKSYDVIAPVSSKEGIHFKRIKDPKEIKLDGNQNSIYPPKNVFLPQSEVLFTVKNDNYEMPDQAPRKRIVFGMRPCDARAVWLLDTIFNKADDLDLYWGKRREKALIISVGCASMCSNGFCDTVGSGPFGKDGSDILITELDDAYFVDPLTSAGEALIKSLPEADDTQGKNAKLIQKGSVIKEHQAADLPRIREKLYEAFNTSIWKDVSESCLGCGVCTYLCPTCFCFDIVDEIDRSERVRNWDTCMFRVYSAEASGHNPRPTKAERTRQRIMHKFAYWVDNEAASGCTGCGRCISQCPVNLDIREMVQEITSLKIQ